MTYTNTATVWELADHIAPHVRTMLLYGPPGTGKSRLARLSGLRPGQDVYPIVIHSDLPAAELRGHFVPQSNGGLIWHDGPAVAAWRSGGRLVLDEIDKAGDDSLSFLLGVLDNHETAKLVLGTTGEIITPHPDFVVIGTMNGEPDDLPPALQDRFPVSLKITAPHPDAIARLPRDLRALAADLTSAEDGRRIGLREFLEFDRLRGIVDPDIAAQCVFGDRWQSLAESIKFAANADPR